MTEEQAIEWIRKQVGEEYLDYVSVCVERTLWHYRKEPSVIIEFSAYIIMEGNGNRNPCFSRSGRTIKQAAQKVVAAFKKDKKK